jgi:hypothetical protein
MAKFKPIDLIKSLSGKICSHSDTYFQKRRRTLCTGRICNPRTKPYTEAELARQAKFKQAIQAVAALSQEQIADYLTAFEKQRKSPNPKYAYLRNFMIAQEYAKLN